MSRRAAAKRAHSAPAPGRAAGPRAGGSKRRWLTLLLLGLAAGATLYLVRRPILVSMASLLVASDRMEKADAAVVLGGEQTFEGCRVRAAIQLYRDGWVRKVVLSGTKGMYGVYETEFSLPLAVSQGVPRSDILTVPHATRSTLEEARVLIGVIERRGIRSIYVVTSNYHTRRARRIFVKACQGRLRVLAHPAADDWFNPDRWWQTREGRKTYLIEFLKAINSLLE